MRTRPAEIARRLYHHLPVELRADRVYWQTLELLQQSERWGEERNREYQLRQLRGMLAHCSQNVPYYRDLFRTVGFDPEQLRDTSQMQNIPTLDLDVVRRHRNDLFATNISRSQWMYCITGGTLGRPLELYTLRGADWRERAFIETMWGRVGFRRDDLRALLRDSYLSKPAGWFYEPKEHAYVFSNFHLSSSTAARYAQVMKEKGAQYLHCYPSSMVEFAKRLQEAGCDPPPLRAMLAGSENIYPGQRELGESFFGCRMFTWLGHTENTVLAASCECSDLYHVFPQYGYVEVLRADGTPAEHEGEEGELVGTSFFNRVMPLVRYRTGDWGVLGPKECACGRAHLLLRSIIGRRNQEVLIGGEGSRISVSSIDMQTAVYRNVRQFQIYQREPGKVELKVVRDPHYSHVDTQSILRDLTQKTGHTIEWTLNFVHEIPLTGRGKWRAVVQEAASDCIASSQNQSQSRSRA